MSTHVKHNADGTLEIAGDAYRIDDRDRARCEVIRVKDGQKMGAFTLADRAVGQVEAAEGAAKEIVAAIADAWSDPRSPFPIQ